MLADRWNQHIQTRTPLKYFPETERPLPWFAPPWFEPVFLFSFYVFLRVVLFCFCFFLFLLCFRLVFLSASKLCCELFVCKMAALQVFTGSVELLTGMIFVNIGSASGSLAPRFEPPWNIGLVVCCMLLALWNLVMNVRNPVKLVIIPLEPLETKTLLWPRYKTVRPRPRYRHRYNPVIQLYLHIYIYIYICIT